MARFNTIKLGSIYFTKTGLSSGLACKVSVTGLDKLKISKRARIVIALDGTPHRQTVAFNGKGFPISVTVEVLPKSVFDSIVAAIESASNAGTTLTLDIAGDTGNFNLTVIPDAEPISFDGKFLNGRVYGATFNFITTG